MLTLIISEEVKKYVGHDREGLDRDLLADFEGGEEFVEPGILPNGRPMRGHQRAPAPRRLEAFRCQAMPA